MADAASAAVPEPLLRGLPDVISIWEILVRLPPKALLRCRAVCPAWRRATSTRDFLLAHHRQQPTFPLLHAYDYGLDGDDGRSTSIDIIPFDHRAGVTTIDQLLLQAVVARLGLEFFFIEASCDGLLVLSINHMDLCICNPATRQCALLPMLLGDFRLLGMYTHSPTGEYRLLLNKWTDLRHDEGLPTPGYAYHVFTVGSGQPPRQIGCPDGGRIICARVPLLLHGRLHWHQIKSQMIVVFDTTAESFRQMRSPVVSDDAGLFEIGGMLGMSSLNDGATTIHIWVKQDYEGEVWSLKHRVELPVVRLSVQFGEFNERSRVVVPCGNDDVIVLVRFGEWLLQIDSDGKLVASFHRIGLGPSEVRLKQSLVPHTFFPALEGYVVDDSPFMSTEFPLSVFCCGPLLK